MHEGRVQGFRDGEVESVARDASGLGGIAPDVGQRLVLGVLRTRDHLHLADNGRPSFPRRKQQCADFFRVECAVDIVVRGTVVENEASIIHLIKRSTGLELISFGGRRTLTPLSLIGRVKDELSRFGPQ
jgi:hypothetical protein